MDLIDVTLVIALTILALVVLWTLFVTVAVKVIVKKAEVKQTQEVSDLSIPLQVEKAGDQFLCYHAKTMAFVCQGTTLEEIRQRFKQRFPHRNAIVVDGDDDAITVLKKQLDTSIQT